MNRRGSVPVIILVILLLIALALSGGGFYLYQKEHAKNLALEEQLEEVKTRQRLAEEKLSESKKAIAELQEQMQRAQAQFDMLVNEYQKEKAARQEALAMMDQVKADLEQQKESRLDLENKLTQAQADAKNIQGQLKQLEADKKDLEAKLKEAQNVELGTIVVSPESASPKEKTVKKTGKEVAKKALEGRVLVLNKDYNFGVIDLGSRDGVGLGNIFSIYHKNQLLGEAKVEKVHDSMAAIGFTPEEIKNKVTEGDKVVQKVK